MRLPASMILILSFMTAAAVQLPADGGAGPQAGRQANAGEISAQALREIIDGGKGLIVDVRDPKEFENDTVPGAANIPLDQLDAKLKGMSKETLIVFVCNNGKLSSRAQKLAEKAGFKTTMYCALQLWKNQGYLTEPGRKKLL